MRGAYLPTVLTVALLAALAAAPAAPERRDDPAGPPVSAGTAGPPAQAVDDRPQVPVPPQVFGTPITPDKPLLTGTSDASLRVVVDDVIAGRFVSPELAVVADGNVRVEVIGTNGPAAKAAVEGLGGAVLARFEHLVLADVPAVRMGELEASDGVETVRLPLPIDGPGGDSAAGSPTAQTARDVLARKSGAYGTEIVAHTGVAAWHAAGQTGQGIKVGIIDSFDGATWESARAAGEVPAFAGAFCLDQNQSCGAGGADFWKGGRHGVAVAEVIHDMAPSAAIYLVSATTSTDLRQAIDYLAGQGVRIITRSLGGRFDGPGNGTGVMASTIAYAESRGIAWFNSAGNAAGNETRVGGYFRSGWVDPDGDGYMNFPNGSPYLAFNCSFIYGLRWSDWGVNRTDYDIFIFEEPGGVLLAQAVDDQQGTADPLEHFYSPTCTGTDVDYAVIQLAQGGNGTAGDVLELLVNAGVSYSSNPYSVNQPAGDTSSAGAAAIGAVDPVGGATIAPYSSQGPTNDGRTKPDFSAASGMTSLSYANETSGRFTGTSAATPVAAGAAAVMLGASPGWTPGQLVTFLRGQVVDRGAPGPDNAFGSGELRLAPPVAPTTVQPVVSAPGRVGRLRVSGRPADRTRIVRWQPPAVTGGAAISRYAIRVYSGKKRVYKGSYGASVRAVKLKRSRLRAGKNVVFVASSNGTAYGPWATARFRVRK